MQMLNFMMYDFHNSWDYIFLMPLFIFDKVFDKVVMRCTYLYKGQRDSEQLGLSS